MSIARTASLSRPATYAWRVATLLAVLVGWELSVQTGYLSAYTFTPPSAILALLAEWIASGSVATHVWTTFFEAAVGYALGVAIGVTLALTFAFVRSLDELVHPLIAALNAIPKIVLAPLFILWLGLDMKAKIVQAAVMVLFVVFYNVYAGIKNVDRDLINSARVMGASRRQLLTAVYLPATFVWLMTSLRIGVGFAFIGAIIGEYVGANRGLGYLIGVATAVGDMSIVYAGLTMVMLVVGTVDAVLGRLERPFTAWRLF
ncbi:MAG: ABC transporter permease [Planctomycetes bacterium]|nr:ABC transporter permease [Planctomycetota bacterium]